MPVDSAFKYVIFSDSFIISENFRRGEEGNKFFV